MIITPDEFRKYVAQVGEIDPIMVDARRAEGIYVWDSEDKQYIDMLSGICVANIGHNHPKVLKAIRSQMYKSLHLMVYGEFIQRQQYLYARKIMGLLENKYQQIFFVNSGSEAIEGAIKTAKLYTKRPEVISMKNSYHGSTMGAVSLMSDEKFTAPFRPLIPMCSSIEFNNVEDLQKITQQTACVVSETIQAGAGVILPENDYLKKLQQRCKEVGALLIMDEIQTGFGRTGKLFAFQNYDILPDIICIAKSMGGGMPIGGFIGKKKVMDSLNNHHPLIGHASTFGGHPLSLAAARASLKVLIKENIMEDVEKKGEIYRQKLVHPQIKEVRGKGLFNCIVLNEPKKWKEALISCFEEGIITGTHLFNEGCLSIKPPLTITYQEIDLSIEKILKALNKIS
ncbi:MAG: aspartate aminotransferase family protein [Bacteroidales bacterium]|jgi:acetylornithine/succinyldiaminopimelate/putrescine aminotransferase|nr:aspartate aminotransferase family protein [Bacteroidales bacterium]